MRPPTPVPLSAVVRFNVVLRGELAHERREVGGRVPIDGAVGVVAVLSA